MLCISFFSGYSQPKTDGILLKKAASLDTADIRLLIKKGYITQTDQMIIGMYMVKRAGDFDKYTIGQLLDSLRADKQRMINDIAVKNNWGADSVFIKMPNGERFFMGMGALSFEKLVARESLNLPDHYEDDYNLQINSIEVLKKLSFMLATGKRSWITGNVLLLKRDNGQLKGMRIGDMFEISKRVAAAKEFVPFIHQME